MQAKCKMPEHLILSNSNVVIGIWTSLPLMVSGMIHIFGRWRRVLYNNVACYTSIQKWLENQSAAWSLDQPSQFQPFSKLSLNSLLRKPTPKAKTFFFSAMFKLQEHIPNFILPLLMLQIINLIAFALDVPFIWSCSLKVFDTRSAFGSNWRTIRHLES